MRKEIYLFLIFLILFFSLTYLEFKEVNVGGIVFVSTLFLLYLNFRLNKNLFFRNFLLFFVIIIFIPIVIFFKFKTIYIFFPLLFIGNVSITEKKQKNILLILSFIILLEMLLLGIPYSFSISYFFVCLLPLFLSKKKNEMQSN
ncbi:hypothetical protein SU69_04250 [Thermosipho melanesiensis]|uniref:Uncharacterized protein n=1 Tax=Thermosipho melanesiensis TaxID=46541 RepID=A0ABN4V0Z9_9BACT|nr:hypothetical protein [Thermosipho melanesiensis]APT74857.1 hypothetical protein BW47_04480 [Thermosipho melanesiensis]OOC35763.1 hypothetical protein SU68_04305 [Thermosipho melanesiensis]OOC39062.1 hypothetical protein SU69_04250 [Thermosipho melanesiensis]OOC39210.1 hypothetical protein SU70_04250 [Thermosipho melanesiensis]OOC41737.1 hypothetical protein SU71_04240 [Thermosipho melanesiensis]